MIYTKLLQQLTIAALVIMLIGCTTPTTTFELPAPTEVSTVIPRPSPTTTPIKVANFEECAELGNPIQRTYPRQCSNNGEVFEESPEPGIIFGKAYRMAGPFGISMTLTRDGGYLLTGGADEVDVLKLNAMREKEWEYNLGQEFIEQFSFTNAVFGCGPARETSAGGYVIMVMGVRAGASGGSFAGSEKFFTIELDRDGRWVSGQVITDRAGKVAYLDPSGKPIWLTSLGMELLMQRKVVETLDGGYAIAGLIYQRSTGTSSIHLVKTDSKGSFVWEKNLCLDRNIQQTWEKEIVCSGGDARDTIQSHDGGYVMTGGRMGKTWLIKTNPEGDIEWIRSYPQGSRNDGWALLQLPDGGYLVAGDQLIDEFHGNGMLLKTDSAGVLQWSRVFGGGLDANFTAMKQGLNNEIVTLGWIDAFSEANVWLLRIDLASLE